MVRLTARLIIVGLTLTGVIAAARSYGASPGPERLTQVLRKLPTPVEERGGPEREEHLRAIAEAINAVRPPKGVPAKEWHALVATTGYHESGFRWRIINGECLKHECDHGKAKGAFQLHKSPGNAELWDRLNGDVALQVKLASETLAGRYYLCKGVSSNWALTTMRAYAGSGCSKPFKGEQQRLATFEQIRKAL